MRTPTVPVILQEDGNVPTSALGRDIDEWLAHRFDLIDQGAPVQVVNWDIGFAEDTYAVYGNSALLPPDPHPGLAQWRAQGIDWVERLITATHQRGLAAWWNHRIAPVDFTATAELDARGTTNYLKREHPDWISRSWWPAGLWNLNNADLRSHKLRYLEELVRLYPLDGLQIDFARHTPFLTPGREHDQRHSTTDFMRRLRSLLNHVGRDRGSRITLAARVGETIQGNLQDGVDVTTWAAEGLVDALVIGGRTTRLDLGQLRRDLHSDAIQLIPCLDGHHAPDGYYKPTIAYYRGVLSNWIAAGADAISLFNWACARDELYARNRIEPITQSSSQSQVLLQLQDPLVLSQDTRLYAAERRGGYPWSGNFIYRNDEQPLPHATGDHAIDTPIEILSADCSQVDAHLTLVFYNVDSSDVRQVTVNQTEAVPSAVDVNWTDPQIYADQEQPNAGADSKYPITDYALLKITYNIPAGILKYGTNVVHIEADRPTGPGTLEKVEIILGTRL